MIDTEVSQLLLFEIAVRENQCGSLICIHSAAGAAGHPGNGGSGRIDTRRLLVAQHPAEPGVDAFIFIAQLIVLPACLYDLWARR